MSELLAKGGPQQEGLGMRKALPVSHELEQVRNSIDLAPLLSLVEFVNRDLGPVVHGPGERDEFHREDHLGSCDLDLAHSIYSFKLTKDVTTFEREGEPSQFCAKTSYEGENRKLRNFLSSEAKRDKGRYG